MTTNQAMANYTAALKSYRERRRAFERDHRHWVDRRGPSGGGGRWMVSKMEYATGPEPIGPDEPKPQDFQITGKIELSLAAEARKRILRTDS